MRLGSELGIAANEHLPILSHPEIYNIRFILSVISFEMGRLEAMSSLEGPLSPILFAYIFF